MPPPPPTSTLFPYTTLFRSASCRSSSPHSATRSTAPPPRTAGRPQPRAAAARGLGPPRSEEHTSELQSRFDLVCRLLLEKKNTTMFTIIALLLKLLRRISRT